MLKTLVSWRIKHFVKTNNSALRIQIAAMLKTFFSIRGRPVLSNAETAVVMRRGFETFVTADLRDIGDSQNVMAMVCLRDVESYKEFKRVQADNLLRGGPLGEVTLNHLASQITEELLRQITDIGDNNHLPQRAE